MKRNKRRFRKKIFVVCVFFIITAILISSCSGKKADLFDERTYLGDYSYNSSLIAMCYENFDGEGFGIVYRELLDFTGYVTQVPLPVLLYFYAPRHEEYANTTAQVEQIAEDFHETVRVISIHVFEEMNIAKHYQIESVPDFILLNRGVRAASFDSNLRLSWTEDELRLWVQVEANRCIAQNEEVDHMTGGEGK